MRRMNCFLVRVLIICVVFLASSFLSPTTCGQDKLPDKSPSIEISPDPHLLTLGKAKFWRAVFSPDGSLIASASGWDREEESGELVIWDVNTGERLLTKRNLMGFSTVAFAPDGTHVAVGGFDHIARMFHVDSGSERKFRGHLGGVNSVAFSKDGTSLVTGSLDFSFRVWDLSTGRVTKSITAHEDVLYAIAISPDGETIATASADTTAKLWDVATGKMKHHFTGHQDRVGFVTFSPDGSLLATAGWDGAAKVWNAETGKLISNCSGTPGRTLCVDFENKLDNPKLATSSRQGAVTIWDPRTGKIVREFEGHKDQVHSVCFSPDNTRLATASFDKTIAIWEIESGKQVKRLNETSISDTVVRQMIPTVNQRLVTLHQDNVIVVRHAITGQTMCSIPVRSSSFRCIETLRDNLIAVGCANGTVEFIDMTTGKTTRSFKAHNSSVRHIAFVRQVNTLATSSDGSVKLWNFPTLEMLEELPGKEDVSSLVTAPVGTSLAFARANGQVTTCRILDLSTIDYETGVDSKIAGMKYLANGSQLLLRTDSRRVYIRDLNVDANPGKAKRSVAENTTCVAVHENARIFAIGNASGEIKVFDDPISTDRPYSIRGPQGITTIAFAPNDKGIITGYQDGVLRLWTPRPAGPKLVKTMSHPMGVTSVRFSDDEKLIATGASKTMLLWDESESAVPVSQIKAPADMLSIAFSPVDESIVMGCADGAVLLLRNSKKRGGAKIKMGPHAINALHYSADGKLLAAADNGGIIGLWDLDSRKQVGELVGHERGVSEVLFSNLPDTIVSCGDDQTARVWNWKTQKQLHKFNRHVSTLSHVAVSPDGKTIASAGNWMIKLWDASNGSIRQRLKPHQRSILCVAFDPTGRFVASGADDGTLEIWDIEQGGRVCNFAAHRGATVSTQFSPRDLKLVTLGGDRVAKLWDLTQLFDEFLQ